MLETTCCYNIGALIQVAAALLAFVAPRAVGVALLCALFFLLPQPNPRYKPGDLPNPEKYLEGYLDRAALLVRVKTPELASGRARCG